MPSPVAFKQVEDFTGGLNLRADQFQLAPNESPGIVNMEVDPRGGVFTRAGFLNFHSTAVGSLGGVWLPKKLFDYKHSVTPTILLATAYDGISVNGKVYQSTGGNFSVLNFSSGNPIVVKSTNGAGITQWQDTVYIATGSGTTSVATIPYKYVAGNTYATALTVSSPTWQSYALPTGGFFPRAELAITHANKMFVANTVEYNTATSPALTAYPNRLRWSHENLPEDWFQDDYIDIEAGGQGITGLQIVDGQLLIFKPKAVYLLMGYDADNFQLVEMSTDLGVQYPNQCVAGSGGVYFFDYPNGLYFYNRNGIQDIFKRLRPIIQDNQINPSYTDQVTVSFVNNKVWLSAPYDSDIITGVNPSSLPDYPAVNFVFDPTIGQQGAYTMYQSSSGFGLVAGTDWRDTNGDPYYLMINPDFNFPYIYSCDDYDNVKDSELEGATPNEANFLTQYTTRWFDDDRYVQIKTFLSPNFIMKAVNAPTNIRLDIYKDFDSTNQARSQTLALTAETTGGLYGTATYAPTGDGIYGGSTVGSTFENASAFGRAKSIQLEFRQETTVNTGRKWGLNSIAYKYKRRKIRGN